MIRKCLQKNVQNGKHFANTLSLVIRLNFDLKKPIRFKFAKINSVLKLPHRFFCWITIYRLSSFHDPFLDLHTIDLLLRSDAKNNAGISLLSSLKLWAVSDRPEYNDKFKNWQLHNTAINIFVTETPLREEI